MPCGNLKPSCVMVDMGFNAKLNKVALNRDKFNKSGDIFDLGLLIFLLHFYNDNNVEENLSNLR